MRSKTPSVVGVWVVALLTLGTGTAASSDVDLVNAVKDQDHQAVRALLQQQVDVNAPGAFGETALLWTARWDDLETADLLIAAGADVNASNDFGMRPLSMACENGSVGMVQRLLEAGANPNAAVGTGQTPLMTCARAGSMEAVTQLIAHGADVNATESSRHQTALMWAVAEHHPKVMRTLIAHGADIDARTTEGFTVLHFAARVGGHDAARLLLEAGADVNVQSERDPAWNTDLRSNFQFRVSEGSTPLHIATLRDNVPFALFLLEQGADPNVESFGLTPLHWAASTWQNEWANSVLGAEMSVAGIQDRAAKLELITALFTHGADPNAQITGRVPRWIGGYTDKGGATPFMLAAFSGDLEVMRLLHAAGADPMLNTETDSTPLMTVAGMNKRRAYSPVTEDQAIEAAKFLLELGIDPAAANTRGDTALHGVSYLGWNRLLRLLVDHGANVNVVSRPGTTPYLAATGFGDRQGGVNYNEETAELLVELGADPDLGTPCIAQGRCRNLE